MLRFQTHSSVKTMIPIQVAALKAFLDYHYFEYTGYNKEAGAVIYSSTISDWRIQIVFGDKCYYSLENQVTGASVRKKFTKVRTVILAYEHVSDVAE